MYSIAELLERALDGREPFFRGRVGRSFGMVSVGALALGPEELEVALLLLAGASRQTGRQVAFGQRIEDLLNVLAAREPLQPFYP